MNTPVPVPVPVPELAPGDATAPLPAAAQRIQVLFRHALRSGQLNPLIHIVRAHRQGLAP